MSWPKILSYAKFILHLLHYYVFYNLLKVVVCISFGGMLYYNLLLWTQALINILLVGRQSDSEIGHHVITVLYQLSLIEDSTLTSILPQLELKLKVQNVHAHVSNSYVIAKVQYLWKFCSRYMNTLA